MTRLSSIASVAALCLGIGLALAYGGEDPPPKLAPPASADTWSDPQSGLMWQAQPTGGAMNWAKAKAHCQSLSLAGRHDWRLPTIAELRSLIRGCPGTQKGGACGVTDACLKYDGCRNDACGGCAADGGPGPGGAYWPPEIAGDVSWYWSSSAVAGADDSAWPDYFCYGAINDADVHVDGRVRCVR